MNNQEAIKFLKESHINYSNMENGIKAQCVCKLAVLALEKQLPKKPITIKCDESITYRCVCGRFQKQVYFDKAGTVHGHETKYCEYCGQAIDWSESDE